MVDKIALQLDALISAIRDSDAYRTYQQLEEELTTQYPELKSQIDEFRLQNFRMQRSKDIDLFNEVDQFEKKYYQLRKNPKVNAYLEAELEVCHMIQEVHSGIRQQISVGIPDIG